MVSSHLNTLQTGVALKRIAVYLDEDEVTAQVSSLKGASFEPLLPGADDDKGLGLVNASFKWNEVEEAENQDKDKGKAASPTATSDDTTTAVNNSSTDVDLFNDDLTDHRFELRDVSVMFPEGELSVITGPTASGKTALLVRSLLFQFSQLP